MIQQRVFEPVCWQHTLSRTPLHTAPAPSTSSVRVTFTVPHRVRFGQHVCIIGAGEALGEWDPVRAVGMTWTEGDIWQAEVDVEAMYVVVQKGGESTLDILPIVVASFHIHKFLHQE